MKQIDLEDFGPDLMASYCKAKGITSGAYATVDGKGVDNLISVNEFHKTIVVFDENYR